MPLSPFKTHFTLFLLLAILAAFFPLPKTALAATIGKPPSNLGLVGYWPLDDATGYKAGDASGNGNAGTITGGTWTTGKKGGALNFNGSSDYIAASTTPALDMISTDITTAAWIYIAGGAGTYRIIISKNDGLNSPTYEFGLSNGNKLIWYQEFGGSALRTSNTSPSLNTWHHVAFVFNNAAKTGTFYLDGVADGAVSGLLNTETTSAPLYIGVDAPTGVNEQAFFNGKIDDLRLYSRELSATEITALYQSGQVTRKLVSNSGLVGYWPMNEGSGGHAGDSSGNGNTGIITSATWTTGKKGGALNFNGSTNYIVGSQNLGISGDATLTLSLWVKASQWYSNYAAPISIQRYATAQGLSMTLYGGRPALDFYQKRFKADNALSTAEWHFVVMTKTPGLIASTSKIYVDGSLVTGAAYFDVGGDQSPNITDSKPEMGRLDVNLGGGTYAYFNGIIDDVRVYNRALSAAEIAALYTQNETKVNASQNSKMTEGLVGLWSFDGPDVSGATVYDRSGNARNSTLTGSPAPAIGKVGQGMNFTGSGQYTTASGFSEAGTSNRDYTFAAWVRPNSGETDGNIIHMSSRADALGWCLPPMAIVSGYARGYSWNGGGVSVTGTSTISSGVWTHIVNTWDASGGLKIYVNGSLENTTSQATYIASGLSNYLWLAYSTGSCAGDAGDFDGSLDDVRVYSRSLTAAEVYRLYTLGK